jgi:hypothetical protein
MNITVKDFLKMEGTPGLGVDTEDEPSARMDGGWELPFYLGVMHQS